MSGRSDRKQQPLAAKFLFIKANTVGVEMRHPVDQGGGEKVGRAGHLATSLEGCELPRQGRGESAGDRRQP